MITTTINKEGEESEESEGGPTYPRLSPSLGGASRLTGLLRRLVVILKEELEEDKE